jgi:3-deoxy-manno-octulosonate cytidylyltransferase (CMP-KDO synthetase)
VSVVAIIPARLASTRFHEKVLASDTGRPMVQHVVDRVRMCRSIDRVIVAADDRRIVDALRPFETEVVLTEPAHPTGTDRIAEVAQRLDESCRWIVNIQADEPEIEPSLVDDLVDRLTSTDAPIRMATAAVPFARGLDPSDPNLVKVVLDAEDCAIYFSRSLIPYRRDDPTDTSACLLHIGIYGFDRNFLLRFASTKPTPLEQLERLEQLRVLEHGVRIAVVRCDRSSHGIDTPEQYRDFVARYLDARRKPRQQPHQQQSSLHPNTKIESSRHSLTHDLNRRDHDTRLAV